MLLKYSINRLVATKILLSSVLYAGVLGTEREPESVVVADKGCMSSSSLPCRTIKLPLETVGV